MSFFPFFFFLRNLYYGLCRIWSRDDDDSWSLKTRFRRRDVQVPVYFSAFAVVLFEPFVCFLEVPACELLGGKEGEREEEGLVCGVCNGGGEGEG